MMEVGDTIRNIHTNEIRIIEKSELIKSEKHPEGILFYFISDEVPWGYKSMWKIEELIKHWRKHET